MQIEAPDFGQIRKESGVATRDAVNLLWTTLNYEMSLRAQTVKFAQDTLQGKALTSAVTTSQNNFDTENALTVTFTGASAFNITGIRNGIAGRVVLLHNLGVGTITLKNESASSDAANRITTVTAGDKTVTTGQTACLHYSASRWHLASFV